MPFPRLSTHRALAALLSAAVIALPAAAQAEDQTSLTQDQNWTQRISQTANGFQIGNPVAQDQLIEYISYTCPHCATFHAEATAPINIQYVRPGLVRLEIRSFTRNIADVAVSLLTQCRGASLFPTLHAAYLAEQQTWLGRAQALSTEQQEAWNLGSPEQRLNAVATDLGLLDIAATHGVTRAQARACLSDTAKREAIVAHTQYAVETIGVQGTPGFTLNGDYLEDVYDWQALEPLLARGISAD